MSLAKLRQRAVFLDRDGVINQAIVVNGKPYPPRDLNELVIIDGVHEACLMLKQAGFLLIVVSNQPDVARKKTSREEVEVMHDYLKKHLPLDAIYACYHDDQDRCTCRKPKPGMLFLAEKDFLIDLKKSVMVGDRYRDIEAAQAALVRSVFIDYGYIEPQPNQPDLVAKSLRDACLWIIQTTL